jgi:hypothetical protein
MAAHASLLLAAQNCFEDMTAQTIAGTLPAALATFLDAIQPTFSDDRANDHPILNWIAVLYAYQVQMSGGANNYVELRVAADYMYRFCFMAYQAQTQTPALITGAQAAVILAAYNANFG